ncbi:YeeE/YedE family protein [Clostridium novyi A str. BKT29909]|uniref:YeeE/YedE thiosulfate transporter family protein n=1 Tax=Clostridium TaxID=1485 RepID=UPI0004D76415|nr:MULTISPECIES: YeeE/YedE thiosulfate transporter family protein [Clostridium]KEH87080.1 YeeE/YedE family protein [Clostridium novyi A str. 4540]KEH88911.1 YeeE/YedE family protein [Clostridium novyi A str. BKT29909]KEH92856.1 YeeE/YedE family protein [Clostridium botulinum C/D str. It1]
MVSIKKALKRPLPYWIGGILLGILNVVLLALSGISWQITSGFLLWAVGILQWFGFEPLRWQYFSHFRYYYDSIIKNNNVFFNKYTILNLGVILGALIATLLASQFKWKKIKSKRQLILALIGGIMMGYGTRIAFGCTVGSFFSGIPSFSLHAWIFGIFVILGAYVGTKILIKFFT